MSLLFFACLTGNGNNTGHSETASKSSELDFLMSWSNTQCLLAGSAQWSRSSGGLNGRCPERAAPTGLGAGAAGGLDARCVRFRSHRVNAAGAACDPKRAPLDAAPSTIDQFFGAIC